ncbi:MAG: hypothetical protein NZ941_00800 [Candidatus Caldarchaeum sp.]|nr:hypothetical protein [Candidatus Caldarchaeum sp.]
MVYLSEQLRQIRDEETMVSRTFSGTAGAIYSDQDWVTVHTENISLPRPQLLYISFTVNVSSGVLANARVRVNNIPRLALGPHSGATVTRWGFIPLPAGNHQLRFDLSAATGASSSSPARYTNINIGRLAFADTVDVFADSGNVSIGVNQTIDPLLTINIPASMVPARMTAVGRIRAYTLWATVTAFAVDNRGSVMRNASESASGRVNWWIKVDDVLKEWTQKVDDAYSVGTNPSFAEGTYGLLTTEVLSADQPHSIKIGCHNGLSSAQTVRVVVSAFLCPWIMPGLADVTGPIYEPLLLDIPKGSTVYVLVEPLYSISMTRRIWLGKRRFISFGDATDYFSQASAASNSATMLSWNYTFEMIDPANVTLLFSGAGACIGAIAADIR